MCKMAAERGYPMAENDLGVMLTKGEGTDQDVGGGIRWLNGAAKKRCGMACFNLGLDCEQGQGLPKDVHRAISWYQKAWVMGEPKGAYRLARLYRVGQLVPKNEREASLWKSRADLLVKKVLEDRLRWFRESKGRAVLLLTAHWCPACGELEKDLPKYAREAGIDIIIVDYTDLDRLNVITGVFSAAGFSAQFHDALIPTIISESSRGIVKAYVGYSRPDHSMRSNHVDVPLKKILNVH